MVGHAGLFQVVSLSAPQLTTTERGTLDPVDRSLVAASTTTQEEQRLVSWLMGFYMFEFASFCDPSCAEDSKQLIEAPASWLRKTEYVSTDVKSYQCAFARLAF